MLHPLASSLRVTSCELGNAAHHVGRSFFEPVKRRLRHADVRLDLCEMNAVQKWRGLRIEEELCDAGAVASVFRDVAFAVMKAETHEGGTELFRGFR